MLQQKGSEPGGMMVTLGLWCALCTSLIPSVWPSDVISRGLYADPSKARKTSEHDFYFRYKKNILQQMNTLTTTTKKYEISYARLI